MRRGASLRIVTARLTIGNVGCDGACTAVCLCLTALSAGWNEPPSPRGAPHPLPCALWWHLLPSLPPHAAAGFLNASITLHVLHEVSQRACMHAPKGRTCISGAAYAHAGSSMVYGYVAAWGHGPHTHGPVMLRSDMPYRSMTTRQRCDGCRSMCTCIHSVVHTQ